MRLFAVFALTAALLSAQHDMSQMPGMGHMQGMADMPGMSHSDSEPMQASGTSLNPAASPVDMVHLRAHGWTFMLHGLLFLTEIQQTGPRGADKLASMNWFMGRASHPLGGGTFSVRSMISLDPATITSERYPELFQTGETAYGKPIVDGQHPHNLFMELALEYTHPLGEKARYWLYAAPIGDPALGPVAYPHRVSAAELPQAALGHHLEDSTHISYEVFTAGVSRGIIGIEGSGFHGAEPGENRWNIGHGGVDSYSGRLTVAPNSHWSAQVSAGRLSHPEALEPGDQVRVTASVTYVRPFSGGEWATSGIWGHVHKTGMNDNLNGFDFESYARFKSANYVTGRIEAVDKDELVLPGIFRIGAYTAGYTRDLNLIPHITSGLGANVTQYSMPGAVHPFYGAHPVAVLVFLRFRLRGV
jgi:hypothetical protein